MKIKTCIECGKEFSEYLTIDNKKHRLKTRKRCFDCVPFRCRHKDKEPQKLVCSHCSKVFYRMYTDENQKNFFCSSSCSAKYNNTRMPKRKLTKKCKQCGCLISCKNKYCKKCIQKRKNDASILNQPLSKYLNNKVDANRYRSIRDHARKITSTRQQICKVCGYDIHVETCHIKEIKNFMPTSLVSEINDPKNLILLCRNCHWELDNKHLKL
jgi:hypothetical protein